MADTIDLLREVLERRAADHEAEVYRQIEELRTTCNVLIERVAELTVGAAPPPVEVIEAREPEPESPAAEENEDLAEELEEQGEDPAAVQEVTDIVNEIATDVEEETRPERMHWLHRPLFGRRDMMG